MADNMENASSGQGGSGLPSQTTSTGAGSSASAVDYAALAAALKPVIAEEVERATQSTKDKRFAKVLDKQDSFESKLTELEELMSGGLSKKAALRVMSASMGPQDDEPQPVVQQPVGNRQPAPKVDHGILISNLGLDANDPDVINVLANGGDELAMVSKYVQIAQAKKQKPAPTPTPAGQMPVPGGSSVTVTEQSLFNEYRDMIKNAPQGEAGAQVLFNAKLAIRKKAAENELPPPV